MHSRAITLSVPKVRALTQGVLTRAFSATTLQWKLCLKQTTTLYAACRKDKRNTYSRRRKYHADKDVDFINDRNAHFNKKIERAFGQYTVEVKANLERGTALPEH